MSGKVKCTCGWSWNKSDSSAKDMYICHECGRDNSNNMKNGGWLDNYNDYEVSAPEGMIGNGLSNVGRNSSPAWGGQFQEGGKLKFLQPTSDKLPEGYVIPYDTPSSERAMSIGGEDGEPAYLIPSFKYGKPLDDPMGEFRKTGEHLGGPFKTWQEADKWENETRHPAVEKGENIMFPQEKFQVGGVMPGAVGHMYARTGSPSKGPRRNQTDVTDASAQNGKEMQYYQQGLDWKPKTISKNGAWLDNYEEAQTGKSVKFDPKKFAEDKKRNTPLQKSIDKESISEDKRRWFDTKEYKDQVKASKAAEDKAILQDRKDRTNKSVAAQKKSFTKDNWRQQLADETQATGDKFRIFPEDPDSFIDEWMNPGVMIGNMASDLGSAPLRAQQEDSYMPYVTSIGVPLLTGGLEGIGAKTTGQFVSNLVNPLNIVPGYKSAERAIGQQLGNVRTSIAPELRQGLQTAGPSFGSRLQEHIRGLDRGIVDLAKGRPFFETFPITQAQKKASDIIQDQAKDEGVDFVNNWFYKNGQLRPEVENRIDNIYLTEPHYGTGAKNNNPLSITKNKLVSTRSKDLPFENISDDSREYIEANRGKMGGFNSEPTNESITFRNMGMYRLPAQEIKNTVVHEAGHTAQNIGDYIPWGTMTTDYSPEFKYFTSNPDTNIGKRFKNALRTPRKTSGDNYAHRTWQSSPNELHSELMSARSNLYDKFLKQGIAPEEAMDLLQNPGDETLDALHKIGGLDQFYKKSRWGKSRVPMETKRDLMRILPAAVPLTVGAGALQQQRDGGIIKDDRGQWDHPGEITEIGSNQITMQGVPYPVLGISDTGDTQMMYPNQEYQYNGSSVTEFPMAQNGLRQEQKGLQNLDNLVNFTNYNTKQPGGWLEKFATGGSVTEVSPEEYTIEEGNTLFEIARDKNVPLSTLAAANKIENPDLIKTGNKLAIPKQFKKELSFNEIPTIDNKKIVIDNFSPHYDYIIEGDKTYYKVKSGNTWADISNNKQARANLTTFLDKNNYWAGYGSGEKAKYDKVHHQPVVVPGSKIPKTQPSIIKNTETGNKPVIVKRPIAKVAKEEPSFFDDISDVVSSSVKSLETKWGDVKKETKNIVKDVENTISSGLNNAISTTEDAYHTVLNGIERKFKTHTGQDDDAKVTTKVNLNPKTVKEWYGNKSGAEITQVIDAPNTNGRTYKQQVLPASNIKFGVRNRGEYKDIKTDGLEVTTFNPFTKDKLPDETSVLAIDGKGNLHTGQYKDFKGQKDFMFSKTFRNKIIDFPEVNGKGQYISGEKSGNPKYQQPKIKVLDDKGKVVDGSLNILVKDDSKKDYYGQVQGGRILFVNPTTKEQYLVSGSISHIKQKFKELKGDNKYLEAYTLDNGTYSRGLSYKDKKLTKDRLKSYDLENTGGGNGLYILDYKQPVSKYEEDYIDNMPNVRTKNDTSYKKGHALKNEVKNIVLHHTAYTGPNAEKELNKQYMTPGQNSSHIVIQENGKRSVYASPEQVTFHAGESEWNKRKDVNDFSIGVEFQGDTNKKPLTQAQIESFVEYYAPIAKKYNLSLKDVITHQMVAPGRKPDINEKQYSRILKYMREKNFK